ncbi:MAG: anaerobic ribonucleoside-triphosphate reductase activating protein [Lachnospiraceae bacterium]|nr:anaerobic ribonucleoside-triphosphate reductase activating protein [Lachnospiraceae bacterium]
MNYSEIKTCDIANGTGVRTTLFVSGCRNHCEGCFQPETWNFDFGKPFDEKVQEEILDSLIPSYVHGLTLLGGDPFEEENQEALIPFMREFKKRFPNVLDYSGAEHPSKNVWAFTGYLFDDLLPGGKKHTEYTDELLSYIDVLVDGPFIQEKKNLMLKFRGSENQRLIDMNEYRRSGNIVTILGS